MTPYLQLRLWWQRANSGDRLGATIAVAVVLALIVWALAPTVSGDNTSKLRADAAEATATGDANGAAGPAGPVDANAAAQTATDAATVAGQAVSARGPASKTAGPAAIAGAVPLKNPVTGAACPPTPKGVPGVTDKNVAIDVAVLDLAGPIGNSAAGQASADDLQKLVQALLADINARGGMACRQATAKYYKVNPIGPDQGRNACLQIIQDHPAMVLDGGGFAFPQSAYLCIPQQKIPLITASLILTSEASKFAPYIATPTPDLGTVMRNTAFGLRDLGFFDPAKGFKKLGLLYDQCAPEVNKQLDDALAKVGITAAQISKFTFACPAGGFASPAEMTQAMSQHRAAGVTHVIPLTGGGSHKAYAAAAEQSGFHPKTALTAYQGAHITAGSATGPTPDSIDGALDMEAGKYGMDKTPGFPLDAPTRRCQDIAEKAGLSRDIISHGGGGMCSLAWTAEAAFNHAQALTPDAVLPGLFAAGLLPQPFAQADVTFKAPSKFYGGDTWWPIQFHKECACWHILDGNRRPSYAP